MRAVTLRDVYCVHRTSEGDAAALQGMTLTVTAGEVVCVLGPSGSGKSTLLRVIAGLQTPSAGEVSVLGENVSRDSGRARARLRQACIGFLSDRSGATLPPDLPIGAALTLPLALRGASRRQQMARRDELLSAVGLESAAQRRPGDLSGGQRQRAALCVALAHRPQLLLADEPTGELDEDSADEVRTLVADLARTEKATMIVVSHDSAMTDVADRTVRIRDGRLTEESGALVVDGGGWIRLPPELLAGAGIGDRVRVEPTAGGIVVRDAGNGRRPGPTPTHTPTPAHTPAASLRPARDSAAPAQVEVRGVARRYPELVVLGGLSWTFAPGRLTAVTGRSASGKTTLLELLAGLATPDAGEVVVDDVSLGSRDAEARAALRRDRVGYLSQDPAPVEFLSASENVALALRIRGVPADTAAGRAAEVLVRVGLGERVLQRVSRLSAGERQRVALARALASGRGLVILDEPTSRLDERAATDIARMLADHAARHRQTVICATHDERLIAHADEVLTLTRAAAQDVNGDSPRRGRGPVPNFGDSGVS